ncbi:hypothetical protein OA263_02270, partial [Candidatus Pelagibacter sp.]|nr:hypothetical protein [Candidatus Pelagibacter sp.]
YTPIYKVNQKSNFGLDMIIFSGDKKIGRKIEKNLRKFRNNQTENIFDANFVSSKIREVVTKDKKGDPSSFKLIIKVKLNLISKTNKETLKKNFIREVTFDSMDNKFELDQYASNIEKNIIFNILEDMNIFFKVIENDL